MLVSLLGICLSPNQLQILINSRPAQTAYPCELRQVDLPGRIGGVVLIEYGRDILFCGGFAAYPLSLALGVLHS